MADMKASARPPPLPGPSPTKQLQRRKRGPPLPGLGELQQQPQHAQQNEEEAQEMPPPPESATTVSPEPIHSKYGRRQVRDSRAKGVIFGSSVDPGMLPPGEEGSDFLEADRKFGYSVARVWYPTEEPQTTEEGVGLPNPRMHGVEAAKHPASSDLVRHEFHQVTAYRDFSEIMTGQLQNANHLWEIWNPGSGSVRAPKPPRPQSQQLLLSQQQQLEGAAAVVTRSPQKKHPFEEQLRVRHVEEDEAEGEGGVTDRLRKQQRQRRERERQQEEELLQLSDRLDKTLPLKFLLTVQGGAATCRARVLAAFTLWARARIKSLQTAALGLWKVRVDEHRREVRTVEYHKRASAVKLYDTAVHVIARQKKSRLRRWVVFVRWLIWIDRNWAALVLQTKFRQKEGRKRVLRLHNAKPIGGALRDMNMAAPRNHLPFKVPLQIRMDKRIAWQAAIVIQARVRSVSHYRLFHRKQMAVVYVQAFGRLVPVRCWFLDLKQRTTLIQTWYRMITERIRFQDLRAATIVAQQYVRRFICIMRVHHMFEVRCIPLENQLTAAFIIQRSWRAYRGRSYAWFIRDEKRREFWAAVFVQRHWYMHLKIYPTFVLVCAMRAHDEAEAEFYAAMHKRFRSLSATKIALTYRDYRNYRRDTAAVVVQCWYRGTRGYTLVALLRLRKWASRKIRCWLRVHLRRHRWASIRIAFCWLRSKPGRLLRHLEDKAYQLELQEEAELARLRHYAAMLIQTNVHGFWARRSYRELLAAIRLQTRVRGFIARRRWINRMDYLRRTNASYFMDGVMRVALERETRRELYRRIQLVRQIQTAARGYIVRQGVRRAYEQAYYEVSCAIKIQEWFRNNQRLVQTVMTAIRRKRNAAANEYARIRNTEVVVDAVLRAACNFYDPLDARAGMRVSRLFKLLGIPAAAEPLRLKNIVHVQSLRLWDAGKIQSVALTDVLRPVQRERERAEIMDTIVAALQAGYDHTAMTPSDAIACVRPIAEVFEEEMEADRQRRRRITAAREESSKPIRPTADTQKKNKNAKRRRIEDDTDSEDSETDSDSDDDGDHDDSDDSENENGKDAEKAGDNAGKKEDDSSVYGGDTLHNYVQGKFVQKFGNRYATRAYNFAELVVSHPETTALQLRLAFATSKTPAEARDSLEKMLVEASTLTEEEKSWEHERLRSCAATLQQATDVLMERISEREAMAAEVDCGNREGSNRGSSDPLRHILFEANNRVQDRSRHVQRLKQRRAIRRQQSSRRDAAEQLELDVYVAAEYFTVMRTIHTWATRARVLQRVFRGHRARVFCGRKRMRLHLDGAKEAYLRERRTNYVIEYWRKQRELEAIEYQKQYDEWVTATEREGTEARLQDVLQFGWTPERRVDPKTLTKVTWYVYNRLGKHMETAEKPIYTYDQDVAVRTIQRMIRVFMARCRLFELRKEMHKQAKEQLRRKAWEKELERRRRAVTISIKVRIRRRPGKPTSPTPFDRAVSAEDATKGASTKYALRRHTAAIKCYDAFVEKWSAGTNMLGGRGMRGSVADTGTAMSACEALCSMLANGVEFRRLRAPELAATVQLRYSRAAYRFGWREVTQNGKTYYLNKFNGRTTTEPPYYTFEEDQTARRLQAQYHAMSGRRRFRAILCAEPIDDVIQRTVSRLRKSFWIGYEDEGIRDLRPPQSKTRGKAKGKPKPAISEHKTYLLLQGSIRRIRTLAYNLRLDQIKDLMADAQNEATAIEQEPKPEHVIVTAADAAGGGASTRRLFRQASSRGGGKSTASGRADKAASAAAAAVPVAPPSQTARAALRLRIGLQAVWMWCRAATKIQTCWRCYNGQRLFFIWRAARDKCVLDLQRLWRGREDRRLRDWLRSQQKSTWEQLWDDENGLFYYYDNTTGTSTYEEPSEPYRPMVRDRRSQRLVQSWSFLDQEAEAPEEAPPGYCLECRVERATRRCEECEPVETTYQGQTVRRKRIFCFSCFSEFHSTRPQIRHHVPQPIAKPPRQVLKCCHCEERMASRQCLGFGVGDTVLEQVHSRMQSSRPTDLIDEGRFCRAAKELKTHLSEKKWASFFKRAASQALRTEGRDPTFGVMSGFAEVSTKAVWASTHRFLTSLREECNECYCKECHLLTHARGKRAKHRWVGFRPGAKVCEICSDSPAIWKCKECQDSLCDRCRARLHRHGYRQTHEMEVIREELVDGDRYCADCDRRVGTDTCNVCGKLACDSCYDSLHVRRCIASGIPGVGLDDEDGGGDDDGDRDEVDGAGRAASNTGARTTTGTGVGETEGGNEDEEEPEELVCSVCGKDADSRCQQCGELYCSISWMGNPGCFKKHHERGNRRTHKKHKIDKNQLKHMRQRLEEHKRVKAAEERRKQQPSA